MKRIHTLFMIVLVFAALGCRDDDENTELEDFNLSSGFLNGTRWEGTILYPTGGDSRVEFAFTSPTDGRFAFADWTLYSPFTYSAEGKLLRIDIAEDDYPAGSWWLQQWSVRQDTLTLTRSTAQEQAKTETLTLVRAKEELK